MVQFFHDFKKNIINNAGVAAVEFGLIMAFMGLLIPSLIDMTNLANAYMRMTNALDAGVRYAYENPTDTTGIQNVIKNSSTLTSAYFTVTPTTSCECGTTAASCGSTCSGGATQSEYLTITTSYQYSGFWFTVINGGSAMTLSNSITIRTQ